MTDNPNPEIPEFYTDETIMGGTDPVYMMYWYLVDGVPRRSMVTGNVYRLQEDLRQHCQLEAKEVRRCNCIARQLMIF